MRLFVALGPIVRALLRRRAATTLLVLEVAFGSAVSIQALFYVRALQRTAEIEGAEVADQLGLLVTETLAQGVPSAPDNAATSARELAALRALPGVRAAAFARSAPHELTINAHAVVLPGPEPSSTAVWPVSGDPELAAVLGVRPYAGRLLDARDVGASDPLPIVISRSVANRLFFPPRDALGKTLQLPTQRAVIVGISEPVLAQTPFTMRPSSVVLSVEPPPADRALRYVVRFASLATSESVEAALAALRRVSPDRLVTGIAAPERIRALNANVYGAYTLFHSVVALIAVIVLLGTFAMSSLLVAERTKQIAIRRALGARRPDVIAHFLIENALLSSAGIAIGIALAHALAILAARIENDILFAWPPALAVAFVFFAVGQLAALGPALRAARVHPRIASEAL